MIPNTDDEWAPAIRGLPSSLDQPLLSNIQWQITSSSMMVQEWLLATGSWRMIERMIDQNTTSQSIVAMIGDWPLWVVIVASLGATTWEWPYTMAINLCGWHCSDNSSIFIIYIYILVYIYMLDINQSFLIRPCVGLLVNTFITTLVVSCSPVGDHAPQPRMLSIRWLRWWT